MQITDDFKDALSSWASGVSVVTAQADGMLYGLTVSSFASLSLEPPLILVCLNNENRLPQMIEQSGGFAVSILSRDQEAASNYFASRGREPTPGFTVVEGEWSDSGQPVVGGAVAYIACELHAAHPTGDHTVVIGRVVEAKSRYDKVPLLYWRRGYRSVEGAVGDEGEGG